MRVLSAAIKNGNVLEIRADRKVDVTVRLLQLNGRQAAKTLKFECLVGTTRLKNGFMNIAPGFYLLQIQTVDGREWRFPMGIVR